MIKCLKEEGFTTAVVEKLLASESASMTPHQKIDMLAELIDPDGTSSAAFDEMRFLFSTASLNSLKVDFDWTLARGLDYYTGAIFEMAPPKQVKVGTIAAGGRYDDLTGTFGLSDMSGIGISFGLDRLYLVLEELQLFPSQLASPIDMMVVQFDQEMITQLMPLLHRLRSSGVKIVVYPNPTRLKKQFHYADKLGIPFVLIVGSEEFEKGQGVLKNMHTGTQKTISLEALDVSFFQ